MEWLKKLQDVRAEIERAAKKTNRSGDSIRLIAVSKGRSVEHILELYKAGQRDFGESRVQEAEDKMPLLPNDITWHFLGTLQSNKVAKVVGRFSYIHSVDSLELAEKISYVSIEKQIVTPVLLQVNISGEASKHGFALQDCLIHFDTLQTLPGIALKGLMTIAPSIGNEIDANYVEGCFYELAAFHKMLKRSFQLDGFTELSMGMSQDFTLAIQQGASMVRIGSRLFN